jgi:Sulfotransferase family
VSFGREAKLQQPHVIREKPEEVPVPPTSLDSHRSATQENVGPLFIVGMPRSGTKLLRGLLNRHPRIRIPDIETDFFPFLVTWVAKNGEPKTDHAFAELFEQMRGATYFTYRREVQPFTWKQWQAHCPDPSAAGLFEGFIRYETGATGSDAVIWGDKSPSYVRHIKLLLDHYPRARIIHIIRDVRDYCVSMRQAWNKDIRRAAFQWGQDVGVAHLICVANPQRCIEIRYEELLQDPEPQMRRLSVFLGIEFTPDMTQLKRPAEQRGDATGQVDIVRTNFSKFGERLSAREIRDVEALAYETMQLLGYKPTRAIRQRHMLRVEQKIRRVRDAAHLVLRGARGRGLAHALKFHLSHVRLSRLGPS